MVKWQTFERSGVAPVSQAPNVVTKQASIGLPCPIPTIRTGVQYGPVDYNLTPASLNYQEGTQPQLTNETKKAYVPQYRFARLSNSSCDIHLDSQSRPQGQAATNFVVSLQSISAMHKLEPTVDGCASLTAAFLMPQHNKRRTFLFLDAFQRKP